MKLVIVESPSKAKTIEKYLGSGYKVMASGGHVCDLPTKRLGVDIEHNFEPEYEINPDKKETIEKLKKALQNSDEVFLATDPDREGEAISWHLKNVLGIDKDNIRVEFNEISKKAVSKALSGEPRKLNFNLINSQQARRVLDRLVGYKISPIISKKIKSGLSAGRVQSVALKMIVEREREIEAFKPEEYWNFFAFLLSQNKTKLKCILSDKNKKKLKVRSKQELDELLANIDNAKFFVDSVKRAESISKPQPPFTTSTMQQDASHKLNLSSPQIMQLAQQLYEGIEIPGEGHVALVTYIRTDSVRVSDDAKAEAKQYILSKYGEKYVPEKYNDYHSKAGAQDAHEAIRPISLDRTPEEMQKKLSRNHYRLYKLIYERFLASQMTEALYDTLTVRVAADCKSGDQYGFSLKGKSLKFDGYTAVYSQAQIQSKDEDDEEISLLPNLVEGENLSLIEYKYEQKFTKPPARYTDASLVKAMEENGIGRPSTYASIISVLNKRQYVEKENKCFKPTALGIVVVDTMNKYFEDIMDYKFTANMESILDKIEEGQIEWKKVISDFYPPLKEKLIIASNDGEKFKPEYEVSDVKCEKCGANMVVKSGRYGKFLACPNFPKCRNIKSLAEEVSKCPKCGKSIVKRRSKKGKIFYSCTGYPDCDFISWEIPAPIFCPKCNSTMYMKKTKEAVVYTCINKLCNYSETHPVEVGVKNDG